MIYTVLFVELAMGNFLSNEHNAVPRIRQMQQHCEKIGSLLNEIFSYEKETFLENTNNLLAVLVRTENINLHEASRRAAAMSQRHAQEVKRITIEIEAEYNGDDEEETDLRSYVMAMDLFGAACWFWQFQGTKQYFSKTSPFIELQLADNPTNANVVVPVTLAYVIAKTGGVDPFKIPRDTSRTDPRVQALTKVGFEVGIKIRMGLPPGVEPKNLPPILELGDLAEFATFNILCSDFYVVENEPGSSVSPNGKWNVWKQQPGHPWTLKTWVSLVHATLDNKLNGSTHFAQNPAKKQRLLKKLENISSTSFSLQQLLLDVDNATVQSVPTIEGMKPGSRAHLVVSGQLGNIWTGFTKKCHCPPIAVVAVPQTSSDPSKLQLTYFDLQVNRAKDSNGVAIKNPTKDQLAVTTLDYRCTTSGKQLPPAKHFSWNWVEPTSVNSESGAVAIKRQVFANYLMLCFLRPRSPASPQTPW
ncbi:hypothetical protein IL306_001607 [Fusarium sp. DS 682]|nr:hypothetical protein IL306_001607 [Fusarium sp. DS 682]